MSSELSQNQGRLERWSCVARIEFIAPCSGCEARHLYIPSRVTGGLPSGPHMRVGVAVSRVRVQGRGLDVEWSMVLHNNE